MTELDVPRTWTYNNGYPGDLPHQLPLAPHNLNPGRLAGFRFTPCTNTSRTADDTALYALFLFSWLFFLALAHLLWHSGGEELLGSTDFWTWKGHDLDLMARRCLRNGLGLYDALRTDVIHDNPGLGRRACHAVYDGWAKQAI